MFDCTWRQDGPLDIKLGDRRGWLKSTALAEKVCHSQNIENTRAPGALLENTLAPVGYISRLAQQATTTCSTSSNCLTACVVHSKALPFQAGLRRPQAEVAKQGKLHKLGILVVGVLRHRQGLEEFPSEQVALLLGAMPFALKLD